VRAPCGLGGVELAGFAFGERGGAPARGVR
jgi:hypothetical protein